MSRLLLIVVVFFALAAPASALPVPPSGWQVPHVGYPGLKHLTYRVGPLNIRPGQSSVLWAPPQAGPRTPGYITRFEPLLLNARTGKPVPASILYMHHIHLKIADLDKLAADSAAFPAGAERTIFQYPRGFGYKLDGKEEWRLNYMIHNLTSDPYQVYVAWRIDYLPVSVARGMKSLSIYWLAAGGKTIYPVFDALKGQGRNGRYTVPDQSPGWLKKNVGNSNKWKLGQDITLLHTSSHLHPGALYSTLYVRRGNRTRMLFRSKVLYFDKKAPASWDMAATSTPFSWRIKLKAGDLVYMNSTYDTSESSWRDSMGDFPLAVYPGHQVGGVDPFTRGASWPRQGQVTHGPLSDNRWVGGQASALPDPRSLPDGPRVSGPVVIRGFRYGIGGQQNSGPSALPPVIPRGDRLTFLNLDSTRRSGLSNSVYHTITACKAPCSAATGLSYPLQNGPEGFDSDTLGFSADGYPPASGRNSWSTPANLSEGTYTYFCRIHPFMRGSFRVVAPEPSLISAGWGALPEGAAGV